MSILSFSTTPILSRYVKKNALFTILAAIIGLWLLQLLFGYLAELDTLSDNYTVNDAMKYMFYKSPRILEETIPTGALVGAVVGLGLLANKSELTVMQASGVSKLKIVSWVLQPALFLVLLSIGLNQFVLPTTNNLARLAFDGKRTLADDILSVRGYWTVQPTYLTHSSKKNTIIEGKDIIFIDYADTKGMIGEVKKWHLDYQGNLQAASIATGGNYVGSINVDSTNVDSLDNTEKLSKNTAESTIQNNSLNVFSKDANIIHQWKLNNISKIYIKQTQTTKQLQQNSDIISLPIEPKSIYLLTNKAEDLSLTQLISHKKFIRNQGNRSLEHELAFWQKLLRPFAILSLVIVACSFVFGSLRTYSLGLRVVVSLLFGLFFSYMQDLVGFVSLATGWSPLLMVFAPILVSGAIGMWLLKRKQ